MALFALFASAAVVAARTEAELAERCKAKLFEGFKNETGPPSTAGLQASLEAFLQRRAMVQGQSVVDTNCGPAASRLASLSRAYDQFGGRGTFGCLISDVTTQVDALSGHVDSLVSTSRPAPFDVVLATDVDLVHRSCAAGLFNLLHHLSQTNGLVYMKSAIGGRHMPHHYLISKMATQGFALEHFETNTQIACNPNSRVVYGSRADEVRCFGLDAAPKYAHLLFRHSTEPQSHHTAAHNDSAAASQIPKKDGNKKKKLDTSPKKNKHHHTETKSHATRRKASPGSKRKDSDDIEKRERKKITESTSSSSSDEARTADTDTDPTPPHAEEDASSDGVGVVA